jgi:serine/threonine-protein kinase RsbW
MSNGESVLDLRFPAKPEYLVLGRLVLAGLARVQPIEQDVLADLKLALTEACSNSIRHAYPNAGGRVEVRYELGPDDLAVEVFDEGPGFDPGPLDAGLEPDSLDEGGLGLAIIQAVSDECEFGQRRDGRGTRLRFARRLATYDEE